MRATLRNLRKALLIAWKDSKIYYFSMPSLMMGLLFPGMMFVMFWLGRGMSLSDALPRLAALTAFFGGSSIGVTTIALERTQRTFDTQLAMPVSLFTLVLGKTIASFLFGFLVAAAPVAILLPFAGSGIQSPPLLIIAIAFSALSAAGLGMLLSAAARHMHEAMTPLNVIRIPMMFISGIFIPISAMPVTAKVAAYLMPLTHSMLSIRYAILGEGALRVYLLSLCGLSAYSLVFVAAAARRLGKSLA